MRYRLTVASDLGHDGDHLTRYQLTAESAGFFGSTLVWGDGSEHAKLARVLRKFPSSVPSSVDFEFGGSRVGRCALRFETVSGTGHCCVWATLEAEDPSAGLERFQQASICIGFEPAALDGFCTDLKRFERGRTNEAILEGHAP